MRCPKCNESLEVVYAYFSERSDLYYCTNIKCSIEDGVYKDKDNLLGFGSNSLVVHVPTYQNFISEVYEREYLIQEARTDAYKDVHRIVKKYHATIDYKVIQKTRKLWKRFVKWLRYWGILTPRKNK